MKSLVKKICSFGVCSIKSLTIKHSARKSLAVIILGLGVLGFSGVSVAMPFVSGQTISWPDDGWYQVQIQGDADSDVCQGGRSCDVGPGTYLVINHTTDERFYDIVVSAPTDPSEPPVVNGNTISWQDNGWYQVQIQGDVDSDVCQGGTSCNVPPGTYVVINITTGERFYDVVVSGLPTIFDVLRDAGNFTFLVEAIQLSGLEELFAEASDEFSLTLFAPNDEAFALLDESERDIAIELLAYHVLLGAFESASFLAMDETTLEAGNGDNIVVRSVGDELFVNDARIVTADIQAINGVVHVIDSVLVLPNVDEPAEPALGTLLDVLEDAGLFGTFIAALEIAELDAALDNPNDFYTVFAITNEAIEALGQESIDVLVADPEALRNLLLFHLIPGTLFQSSDFLSILGFDIEAANGGILNINDTGETLTVNGVNIVASDIPASNGIIHVIDAVLLQ